MGLSPFCTGTTADIPRYSQPILLFTLYVYSNFRKGAASSFGPQEPSFEFLGPSPSDRPEGCEEG